MIMFGFQLDMSSCCVLSPERSAGHLRAVSAVEPHADMGRIKGEYELDRSSELLLHTAGKG